MTEETILNRVAVEQYLSRLSPESRAVLLLYFGIAQPGDWPKGQPATLVNIGRYVGLKYRGEAISEAVVRYIRREALRQLMPGPGKPREKRAKKRSKIAK